MHLKKSPCFAMATTLAWTETFCIVYVTALPACSLLLPIILQPITALLVSAVIHRAEQASLLLREALSRFLSPHPPPPESTDTEMT